MATVVTSAGKAIVANRILGSGPEPNYVAWGTGTTTAVVGQTALVTPSAEARVSGTSSRVTTSVSNDSYQVVATITSAGTQAITEAGLFDALTSGGMFVRGDFAAINLSAGDSVQFTIKVALG